MWSPVPKQVVFRTFLYAVLYVRGSSQLKFLFRQNLHQQCIVGQHIGASNYFEKRGKLTPILDQIPKIRNKTRF